VLKDGSAEEIRRLTEELRTVSYTLAQHMYSQAEEAPGGGDQYDASTNGAGAAAGARTDEDVIDAEFKPS
jgi:hypothetical protein